MQNSSDLAFLRIYYIIGPLNNQDLLIIKINYMAYGVDSFVGFNAKFRRDELNNRDLQRAHNDLDSSKGEAANRSIKKEAHKSDVAKRVEELGLTAGSKIVFNDGVHRNILTIKEINPQTGKMSFEESKVDVGVFSPSLEKYEGETN